MFSCVHQGNLRITPTPSNLTKYAQKTLCTKTPLRRGVTDKTFPDTEKKIIEKTKNKKKTRNETQIPTGFGNPVKNRIGDYCVIITSSATNQRRDFSIITHVVIRIDFNDNDDNCSFLLQLSIFSHFMTFA